MKRGLLAIALGITFLILMTWIGTIITGVVLHRATAQVQTAQVNPNPPSITQPATLSIQILEKNSKRVIYRDKNTVFQIICHEALRVQRIGFSHNLELTQVC